MLLPLLVYSIEHNINSNYAASASQMSKDYDVLEVFGYVKVLLSLIINCCVRHLNLEPSKLMASVYCKCKGPPAPLIISLLPTNMTIRFFFPFKIFHFQISSVLFCSHFLLNFNVLGLMRVIFLREMRMINYSGNSKF